MTKENLSYQSKRVAILALFLCLLSISAYLKIPTGIVPFTLQLLVALSISLLLKPLDGLVVFIVYIIMGLAGIPVFASGGGLGYVVLPSFGFILGFIGMHLCISGMLFLLKKIKNVFIKYLISSFIGVVILYLIGLTYAYFLLNVFQAKNYTLLQLLKMMVTPFILFDLMKIVIASFITIRLKAILNFSRGNL